MAPSGVNVAPTTAENGPRGIILVSSMTGYGQGESVGKYYRFTVEVRSVNHRFNDVHIRLPREFSAWEQSIRKAVLQHVRRGRVDLSLAAEPLEGTRQLKLNRPLAAAYHRALDELARDLGLVPHIPISVLAGMPDLFTLESTAPGADDLWHEMEPALNSALDKLSASRRVEGQALAGDCLQRIQRMEDLLASVAAEAPAVAEHYRQRLLERLREWLPEKSLDMDRVTAEVVIMAERSAIDEEITRLASHLDQLRQCFKDAGPVGRRMEFLLQEAHREVQTMGAKGQSTAIAKAVVEMKSELENLREQVQNIE